MTVIGFHASHEQHAPSSLLRYVRRAEQAGFQAGMCSDHFYPWSARQGHSGYTWSWLGAALEATSWSFGTVCAPGQRYHPAIIAQAAATLAEMYPGRFWLAVGSGEALNEVITGEPWPPKPQRNERLKESVDVMRALWAGETVTRRGLVTVKNARLYTRPAQPPMVVGAALSEATAEWMGGWADALVTVARPPEELAAVVDAFRRGGGDGKPMFLQVALSFARSYEEALEAAHDQWRQAALDATQLADLDSPEAFDRAAASISIATIGQKMRVSESPQQHVDWLAGDLEFGFSAIYLHDVSRQLDRFIDVFSAQVLPNFTQTVVATPKSQ